MDKQFKIYSVDTKAFYTEEEIKLNSSKFKYREEMNKYEDWMNFKILNLNNDKYNIEFEEYLSKKDKYKELKNIKTQSCSQEIELKELKEFFKKPKKKISKKDYKTSQEKQKEKELETIKTKKLIKKHLMEIEEYKILKHSEKEINKEFANLIKETDSRRLNPKALTSSNQITLFENALSRAMNIKADEIVLDMVIVRVYHYNILKQLIENGFTYTTEDGKTKKYRVFTASAGQIRTKKVIFIEENRWNKYEKTLMCGLTISDINNSSEKGCNVNKFLAYLALCNSATDELEYFNIDRTIVIEDFETIVTGEVDYIDNVTFEVERKTMDIPIPHSDGCGWVLPSICKKNYMIRLPWVKGLLTPVDYIKFCDEYRNGNYEIKDIYGKVWNLKDDNIEFVFSKSQFKMYKYYNSWGQYTEYFKKYNCKANYCNLEPDTKDFRQASFNYQMWQTLTDITDEEIKEFTDVVDDFITRGYSNRETMLDILGATNKNKRKTNLQKCIEIYPELIRDYHVKEELASTLNARKKEAKYGKFKIDAKYTFLIPDVFAWMQGVFLGQDKPNGLLADGEVSCQLYKGYDEVLVERSPHLYREHSFRKNEINSMTKKWFITDGAYTSSHDLISKILQFDNDGDKGLVVGDERLKEIAKRNMEGIVPLYYEMGKAKAININESNIYDSLEKAFKYNNIGKFSNKLSIKWNLENINLKTIAQITALNNFTIDAAKTLLVPQVPSDVEKDMKDTNGKLPYFFMYAKDKDIEDVAPINNSTVNRICRNIENIKQCNYDFSSIGKFNKNYLMNDKNIEILDIVVNTYKELDSRKNILIINAKQQNLIKEDIISSVYGNIKKEFTTICEKNNTSTIEAVDMIIKYIYTTNRNSKKGLLFDLFGDIIYDNLIKNIKHPLNDGYIMCNCCGKRVKLKIVNSNAKYCEPCSKEINKQQIKEWKLKNNEKQGKNVKPL